ncbi:NAD(+)--rifampin ADP-ribosyltransferase [Niabella sp. 3A5MI-3]|nr:NAD(+)--rifampin ADP-ribosyltransferase [Niabella beijingensis]MBZ4191839.1 NAD(+)--rifampin ADP-ribosyltransferase [Niabella beijingensis]
MEFNPNNPVIQRCMQGMELAEKGQSGAAAAVFLQAWNEAGNDFEKFIAAHFLARHQQDTRDKLTWLHTALQHGRSVNSDAVKSALPSLYTNMTQCYATLGDADNEKKYRELAVSAGEQLPDKGPFYHGTRADLQPGDLLIAGGISNYQSDVVMNHIYFTGLANGAGLAAALAKGEGRERVYIVEPTGSFENDPNVTDKKFPGNPTRSYRSTAPLKILGEVTDWDRLTPEQLRQWREKLANNKGTIIN